jgi:hypothetical protein
VNKTIFTLSIIVAFVGGSIMTGSMVYGAKGGDPLAPILTAIADLQARMTTAEANIASLLTRTTAVESNLNGNATRITNSEADIADLDTRIGELESFPHMVKSIKFNRLDGPVSQGQTPTTLDYSITASANSDGDLIFQFIVLDRTCSDMKIHYFVDGVLKGETVWLGYIDRIPNDPLSTELISVDSLEPGEHTLTLRPEGRVSGCNTAGIAAWAGTIYLYQ